MGGFLGWTGACGAPDAQASGREVAGRLLRCRHRLHVLLRLGVRPFHPHRLGRAGQAETRGEPEEGALGHKVEAPANPCPGSGAARTELCSLKGQHPQLRYALSYVLRGAAADTVVTFTASGRQLLPISV